MQNKRNRRKSRAGRIYCEPSQLPLHFGHLELYPQSRLIQASKLFPFNLGTKLQRVFFYKLFYLLNPSEQNIFQA